MPNVVYRNFQVVSTGSISNTAPVITSSAVTTGSVGQLYSYDVNASGNPTPTYSLTESPSGMTINPTSGLIEWTPVAEGNFDVTVVASNGISPDATQSFQIIVTETLPCLNGIISYWKLDESSGNTYFDFIGLNDATSTNIPSPVSGRVNDAKQFDGFSTGIVAPGIAAYDFSSNSSFSFETWIKHVLGPYNGEEIIVERKSSSGALAINLKFDESTSAVFSVRDNLSNIYWVTGISNLYDNKWHHIVGVKDGSNNKLKIFVDGILENEIVAPHTGGFESPPTGISIGWRNSTSVDFFNGSIDEVAIYNKALSTSEIFRHFTNGLNGFGYEECQVLADINVFLQGPFINGATIPPYMTTTLNTGAYLPLLQPYSSSPWNYTGAEEVSTDFYINNPGVVDWILVELRDKNDPSILVRSRAGLLTSNGKIVDIDGLSNLGFTTGANDYFLVIKHRNHLAVMNGGSALAFSGSPSITTFDFTGGNVFGEASAMFNLGGGKFGMFAGDANANGQVQNNDSEIYWKVQNGQSGYKSCDFNLNGQVQNNDNESFWKLNNGKGTQVPGS